METLPNELIEIILSMIPTDDLVTKFRAVNRAFFSLSQKIVYAIGPSFKRDQTYSDHQIAILARDYPSITELDASNWDLSAFGLQVILTRFPRLKTLKLFPLYRQQCREMRNHKVLSVTSLSLSFPSSYYSHFRSYNFEVGPINLIFPNLETLELLDSPGQDNTESLLKDVKTIKRLTVQGANLTRIADVPLLKTLTVENNTQASIEIVNCPALDTLNIKNSTLKRFDFLQSIPTLQHLHLQRGFQGSWKRFGDSVDLAGLVNNVTKCQNLKTLRIDQYQITSKDLERLVSTLPNLKKISIFSSRHDENLPVTAVLLQEKHKNVKITVTVRKMTTSLYLEAYNEALKSDKTSDPYVECQYCHLQYQCAPEIHEEVCYKWPAWDCLFVQDGCGKTGMTKDEYRAHIDKCDYNFIICPFTQQCGETIRRHERHEHLKRHEMTIAFRLKETHMICPNLQRGCLAMFTSTVNLSNHVPKCHHSHSLCMSCKQEFTSIDECVKHMSGCKVTPKWQVMPEESIALIVERATKWAKAKAHYNPDTPIHHRSWPLNYS